jgi:hypothetical protein
MTVWSVPPQGLASKYVSGTHNPTGRSNMNVLHLICTSIQIAISEINDAVISARARLIHPVDVTFNNSYHFSTFRIFISYIGWTVGVFVIPTAQFSATSYVVH